MFVYDYLKEKVLENDEIANSINFPEKISKSSSLILSPPFIDLHTHVRLGRGEDYDSLSKAAIAGGFLIVNIQPNTEPPLDNLETLKNHLNLSREKNVKFFYTLSFFGSVNNVNNVNEIDKDMAKNIIGFSTDGIKYNSKDLVNSFSSKAPTIVFDHSQLHEIDGDFYLGTNLPNAKRTYSNEAIAVFRTVMTGLEFGFRNFHIQHISTIEALETIQFLRKFAKVTCEVTPHHVYFTPDMLKNTNQKINPPISKYKDLLVEGVKKGLIDTFATDHAPHPEKSESYQEAPYGSSHIEVSFAAYLTVFKNVELVLKNLTLAPLKVLGKKYEDLNIKFPNDAVLIDPQEKFIVESKKFFSKGKNCAFNGEELIGKILGVRKNGRWVYWNGEFMDK